MTTAALLCLVAAAGSSPVQAPVEVALPDGGFTLAWTHSIEKVEWEEDYLVAGGWLYLAEARVRGSGAGMEVPSGAVHSGGAWRYRPADRWHRELRLTRSPYARDYRLCIGGSCKELRHWRPLDDGVTVASDCTPARRR